MIKHASLFLSAVVCCASAVTTLLTFEGTLHGEDFTISVELNEAYPGNPEDDSFTSSLDHWQVNGDADLYVIQDIYGDIFTGEYETPTEETWHINEYVETNGDYTLNVYAVPSGGDLSLFYNGETVKGVYIQMQLADIWEHSGSFVNPAAYFAGYSGEYGLRQWGWSNISVTTTGGPHSGTLSSVTISQIPEPCTMALLGIGGLTIRRKRNR